MEKLYLYRNRQKGIALILTIVLTAVLASICLAFTYKLRVEFLVTEGYTSRVRGMYLAESGLTCAEILLRKDNATYDYQDEKMFLYSDLASKGGYPEGKDLIRFSIEDENSKLNVNAASKETLMNLFQILEVKLEKKGDIIDEIISSDIAGELADSIIDWRDHDIEINGPGGAEKDFYQTLDEPYLPADAPLRSLRELLLIRNFDERIFFQIKDYVTVWGNGRININTASPEVIRALNPIYIRDDYEYIVHLLIDNRPYKSFQEFRDVIAPYNVEVYQQLRSLIHVNSDCFSLTGIGVVNDVEFRIKKVVLRYGSNIKILYNIRDFLC